MSLFLGAIAGLLGVLFAYRLLKPSTRPIRPEDVGTVSEDWRAQQRRLSDEH